MKTKIQKEMRKIRLKLKQHDTTEQDKMRLRKELDVLREINNKENNSK